MASNIEIRQLFGNSDLRNRTEVQVVFAAIDLLMATPTVDQLKWAVSVLDNSASEGRRAFMFVLGVNKDATVAQILGASDAAIKSNVDNVIPALVVAHAEA